MAINPQDAAQKAAMTGTYDHTEEHTTIYEHLGVKASDSPIDRAWARLYDRGMNPGPAVAEPFQISETLLSQYFQYAQAFLDTSDANVNKTVDFKFGLQIVSESGL